MALPFANDGSFLEQFQAAQQRQQQGQAPQQQPELQQPTAADPRGQEPAGRSAPAYAEQHAQGASQRQGGAYGEGSQIQDWQQHLYQQHSGAESGPWGQPDWEPPASAQHSTGSGHTAHQQQHTQQQLEPGEYRPEAGEPDQHQQQKQIWQQEQQFYAEAAQPSAFRYGGEPGTSASQAWDEQVVRETYDPAAGLTFPEQQQQEYEAGAAAAQQYYEQQQRQQASHAEPPQINDFNECPTFNGPFPGFVFKLGARLKHATGFSGLEPPTSLLSSSRYHLVQGRAPLRYNL